MSDRVVSDAVRKAAARILDTLEVKCSLAEVSAAEAAVQQACDEATAKLQTRVKNLEGQVVVLNEVNSKINNTPWLLQNADLKVEVERLEAKVAKLEGRGEPEDYSKPGPGGPTS